MKKIVDYLVNTKKQKSETAVKISASFEHHDDIQAELDAWIDTRSFPQSNALNIEGYTAADIAKLAPFMDGVGVYNFLVTLRERPDNGKRIIAEGFPRKHMKILEFISTLDQRLITTQSAEKIEQIYGIKLKDGIKQVLSKNPEGIFFEKEDVLCLLSCEEIVNASQDMNVDFIKLKLIPVIDTGDNDYIVYDIEKSSWCKFNIVNGVKFKQRETFKEFFIRATLIRERKRHIFKNDATAPFQFF
ncbi:MAG: hypothetical protein DDT32_00283 [Syntrophomonadaceae bacterium]|nr:hypothetical protein [Bacillota bacterium]